MYKVKRVAVIVPPITAMASGTLALPVSPIPIAVGNKANTVVVAVINTGRNLSEAPFIMASRSEERRVGKECRSRWSPYH